MLQRLRHATHYVGCPSRALTQGPDTRQRQKHILRDPYPTNQDLFVGTRWRVSLRMRIQAVKKSGPGVALHGRCGLLCCQIGIDCCGRFAAF